MTKVDIEKPKNNKIILVRLTMIFMFFFSVGMLMAGIIKICRIQHDLGDKNVTELSADIEDKAKKMTEKEEERDKEYVKNGFSDEYFRINDEVAKISTEISRATNSRYMQETGFNNPRNFGELMRIVPGLVIGAITILVSGIILFILRKH